MLERNARFTFEFYRIEDLEKQISLIWFYESSFI